MVIKTLHINTFAKLIAFIPDSEVGYQMHRKRPGIILAPGGAYLMHATREKEGVALEFIARGYNVYVLEYTVGFMSREEKESGLTQITTKDRYPQPVYEMFEAIHLVKTNAEDFNQDSDHLFLMGFSAGGHLCASAGIFHDDPSFTSHLSFIPQEDELKVTGMVLCYPMLSGDPDELVPNDPDNIDKKLMSQFMYDTETPTREQIAAYELWRRVKDTTCPTFIWHSTDDDIVNALNSTRFIYELQQRNIDCEYHIFNRGGHGLGLCNKVYARDITDIHLDLARWVDMACDWMELH